MADGERFIIVDVGCIECGEQTEVVGIFQDEKEVESAFEEYCKSKEIENWSPRGGFLELLGLYNAEKSTYLGGTGYFDGGQHAIEIHVFPARALPKKEED